jgi:hypothetical protein
MKETITRYRVADGREVVLPRGLGRAPSGENARFTGGETFEVDDENPEHASLQRYIRGRVRAGDIVIESRVMPTTTTASKEGDR